MHAGTIEGIVLQKTDYSDTGIIVRLLTESEGVKSFIFPGGKSKKKHGNTLIPLSLVCVSYTQKSNHNLASIREIEPLLVLRDIPFNPYKSGILFFMNEVLNNTVKEQEDNEGLYHFVKGAVAILDLSTNTRNFPVLFLIQLTHYLGFYPKINEGGRYFDLREGIFVKHHPSHPAYVSEETSRVIMQLMTCKLDGSDPYQYPLAMRRKALYEMLNYYRMLFDHFKDLESLHVLEATFHD
ncbi:MAG: DNA repair protein RecO [Bacteroidetes bacterium]|nr:DNA repair protein RecO [Bacteroidota bacterium]